jgi:hypothetical protein
MVPTTMPEGAAPEYTRWGGEFGIGTGPAASQGAPAPTLGLFPRARAGPGLRRQDGIPDAMSEAAGLDSGDARMRLPVRVEPEELVTELSLQIAAAGGHWRRRARPERRHAEGLNERRLAAAVPVGHLMQHRLDSQQCPAGGFKGVTYAFVESRAHDAAHGLELRVEFVQLDRRRELPIDQPLEICHHPVQEFPERPKGARLLRRARVMRVPGPPSGPSRLGHESPMDSVGADDVADQAEQGVKHGGGCGPLLEGLAHVLGHAERLELAHLLRRRSPAAPRPPL